MNNWNPLEEQLASWRPRQASAALKARLFGAAEAAATADIRRADVLPETHLWRLLAPGLALLLAMCMVSSRGTATFTPLITSSSSLVATATLNQPQLAAYCVGY